MGQQSKAKAACRRPAGALPNKPNVKRFTDSAQNSKTIFAASRTGVALPTATNSPKASLSEYRRHTLYRIEL